MPIRVSQREWKVLREILDSCGLFATRAFSPVPGRLTRRCSGLASLAAELHIVRPAYRCSARQGVGMLFSSARGAMSPEPPETFWLRGPLTSLWAHAPLQSLSNGASPGRLERLHWATTRVAAVPHCVTDSGNVLSLASYGRSSKLGTAMRHSLGLFGLSSSLGSLRASSKRWVWFPRWTFPARSDRTGCGSRF